MLALSLEKSMMEKSNYQTLLSAPPDFEEPLRQEMTECLNHLLAQTITLRELYKKSNCQVAGPAFYEVHLLFDKHNELQSLGEHLVNVSIVEA
jgi:hypothetical protein